MLWDRFISLQNLFEQNFSEHAETFDNGETYQPFHTNIFFRSDKLELGHISVIDKREDRGMWMMHVAAFAKPEHPMPIFGYDVICGKKKVTGCFHDISPTVGNSNTAQTFAEVTEKFTAKRERELPEWAKAIFSPHMVAAGNVSKREELDQLLELSLDSVDAYLTDIGNYNNEADTDEEQTGRQATSHNLYAGSSIHAHHSTDVRWIPIAHHKRPTT